MDTHYKENLAEREKEAIQMAEACRAWLKFMSLLRTLTRVEVDENWYGHWNSFDCRFPSLNDHKELRSRIQSIMRDGFEVGDDPTLFKRNGLYDKMATASFPLDAFVATNVVAHVNFSLPQPMVFAVQQFRFKRCRKTHYDGWWGRLYLVDGRIAKTWHSETEVADCLSHEDATRQQMFEALIDQVKERGDECLFTITGDSLIGAMIKAESENILLTSA